MPKLNNGRLNLGFELEFRWGRDEYLEWVRQGILGCSRAEKSGLMFLEQNLGVPKYFRVQVKMLKTKRAIISFIKC